MCLTWNYLIRRYLVLIQIFVGNAFCVLCFVATSFRKTAFTVSGLTCCFNFSWLWWSRRQRYDLMQKLGEVFIIWSENCFLDLVMKRVAGKLSARLEPNLFLFRPIFCRCCCTLLLQATCFSCVVARMLLICGFGPIMNLVFTAYQTCVHEWNFASRFAKQRLNAAWQLKFCRYPGQSLVWKSSAKRRWRRMWRRCFGENPRIFLSAANFRIIDSWNEATFCWPRILTKTSSTNPTQALRIAVVCWADQR